MNTNPKEWGAGMEAEELHAEVERLTSALAEAESRFANERDRAEALREKAEVLTKERDEAKQGFRVRSVEDALIALLGKAMERGYCPPDSWEFTVPDAVYNALARELTEKFRLSAMPPTTEDSSLTLNSMFGAVNLTPETAAQRLVPASHAEKVLVSVAKAAARIGAEEMRTAIVIRLRETARGHDEVADMTKDWDVMYQEAGLANAYEDAAEDAVNLPSPVGDKP